MLLNPTMAEDVDVLEHYLTSHSTAEQTPKQPYIRVANGTSDDSLVYLSMPRKRQGLQATVNPGGVQREILEHVLGNAKVAVIEL